MWRKIRDKFKLFIVNTKILLPFVKEVLPTHPFYRESNIPWIWVEWSTEGRAYLGSGSQLETSRILPAASVVAKERGELQTGPCRDNPPGNSWKINGIAGEESPAGAGMRWEHVEKGILHFIHPLEWRLNGFVWVLRDLFHLERNFLASLPQILVSLP